MPQIQPLTILTIEQDATTRRRNSVERQSKVWTFLTSIKFTLTFIIFLVILSCTIVFDSIWMSVFAGEASKLSEKVRVSEFNLIISNTERSIKRVVLATESAKSQLYSDFDFNNETFILDRTFRFHKVMKTHLEVFHLIAIGDSKGKLYGIEIEDQTVMYTIINQTSQTYWECKDSNNSERCNHQYIADRSGISSDYSFIPYFISNQIPGKTFFTSSLLDSHTKNLNIACTSSLIMDSSSFLVPNSVTLVIDLEVFFEFLHFQTNNVPESIIAVFETKSKNIIALSGPLDFSLHDIRKTLTTIGGRISKIGSQLADQFNNDFEKLSCNTNKTFTFDLSYSTVGRLCTEEGIDWIFIYDSPQWNYISNMLTHLIASGNGSIGLLISIFIVAFIFSSIVVRPFKNLISSFELVSNMELDNFQLAPSLISEVKSLQVHFIGMVERIRLYRKFIPSHLLRKLDNNNSEVEGEVKQDETSLQEKHKDSSFSNSNSNSGNFSKHFPRQQPPTNMFSLYLENKRVTIVGVFLDGINNLLSNANPKECIPILADVFDVINHVAKISNGQVGKFENETVTIQFNAASEQPKHEMKGLQFCHSLLKKLKNLQETKLSKYLFYENNPTLNLDFHIVATTQECMCGNVGTREIMNFGVFGSVLFNIQTMIETAKELEIPIVISQELFQKIENKFQVRFVDFKNFVLDDYYSYPSVADRSLINTPRKVYELGESVNVEADEWMYELSAKEKNEHWKLYNEATEEYFNENFNNAIQLITKYLQNNAVDRVALHLKKNCEKSFL